MRTLGSFSVSRTHVAASVCSVLFSLSSMVSAAAASVDAGEGTIAATQKSGVASQQRVTQTDDKRVSALDEYRALQGEIDQLAVYNRQMNTLIASQQRELADTDKKIAGIERTERGVLPLMQRMIDTLGEFHQRDVPFLSQERAVRLEKLNALMASANSTVSEKFRRVLEAYQIESDYGRNVEVYREKEQDVSYDFLRVGRLALYKLSLDKRAAWLWDNQQRTWQALDSSYLRDLKQAFKVAEQTLAPQLMILPLHTRQQMDSSAPAHTARQGDAS